MGKKKRAAKAAKQRREIMTRRLREYLRGGGMLPPVSGAGTSGSPLAPLPMMPTIGFGPPRGEVVLSFLAGLYGPPDPKRVAETAAALANEKAISDRERAELEAIYRLPQPEKDEVS